MKRMKFPTFPAIAAFGLFVSMHGAGAAEPRLENITLAVEAFASSITLPSSEYGTLAMPLCAACPSRTFQTTADTQYLLKNQPVAAATLNAALVRNPKSIVTVSYVVKSGVVTQVSAAP